MSFACIKDAKLEETGFNYTMSLIQGKYKMFILYALSACSIRQIYSSGLVVEIKRAFCAICRSSLVSDYRENARSLRASRVYRKANQRK